MRLNAGILAGAILMLAACAQNETAAVRSTPGVAGSASCAVSSAEQELLLSLSQEMVAEGRLHAALANLEQLPSNIPQVQLHMADILRELAPERAGALYRTLLNDNCFDASAHHGLGRLAAAQGFYREASGHLRMAVQQAPTDKDVRNDLGVVYLHQRRLSEARFELMTALELGEKDLRAAGNLLTLLLYEDEWQQASELISDLQLPPAQFEAAQQRARQLLQEDVLLPESGVAVEP